MFVDGNFKSPLLLRYFEIEFNSTLFLFVYGNDQVVFAFYSVDMCAAGVGGFSVRVLLSLVE